jgi:hypothetical protein
MTYARSRFQSTRPFYHQNIVLRNKNKVVLRAMLSALPVSLLPQVFGIPQSSCHRSLCQRPLFRQKHRTVFALSHPCVLCDHFHLPLHFYR